MARHAFTMASVVLASVVLMMLVTTAVRAQDGSEAACTLGDLGSASGTWIGAGFVEGSNQPAFRSTLVREFNSVTAPLYWTQTHAEPDAYDFTAADAAVDIAEANGMRVRGHPLLWGRLGTPVYVQETTDPDILRAVITEHVGTVVGRYRGRIDQYDVVNEPLRFFGDAGASDGLHESVFLRVLGPGYIREALEIAHAADPDARLFINDFFVLGPGAKQDRYFALAQELVASGAPLHGVGFQGHITPPFDPAYAPTAAETAATIDRFGALGLEVEITEVDVTLRDRHPCRLAAQRRVCRDIVAACAGLAPCTGVTFWGISDAFTWIRNFFGVDGAPLLFDELFAPKPAYFGVQDALVAAANDAGSTPDCTIVSCPDSVCPAEPPTGCCEAAADCETDLCVAGRACVANVCSDGTPVDCDDGDPCTVDTCDPSTGCRADDVVGFDAAECICYRQIPDTCSEVPLPSAVTTHLGQACALIEDARDPDRRRARRRLRKASSQLRRARSQARRAERRATIDSDCGASVEADLSDARMRVKQVRRGL
jgi:endo-1,4-beta-xylanase